MSLFRVRVQRIHGGPGSWASGWGAVKALQRRALAALHREIQESAYPYEALGRYHETKGRGRPCSRTSTRQKVEFEVTKGQKGPQGSSVRPAQ